MIITSANVDQFPKFFRFQIAETILYTNIIKILRLTLSVFLPYLVKLNYNCCWFKWQLAREISECNLQDIRPQLEVEDDMIFQKVREYAELQ